MLTSMRKSLLLLAVLAGGALPAFADPDDAADWTELATPPSDGTGLPPTTPEGSFGSPDRTRFDEQLRDRVLDQLCRHLKLKKALDLAPTDFSGLRLGMSRRLRVYSDGTLAVVDDEELRASLSHVLSRALTGTSESLGLGLSLDATLEGRSMVVRRLNTKKSCDEVFRLANFTDIKTVLPMSGERVVGMEVGELWRVPLTMIFTQGISIGETPMTDLSASVSFSRSDAGMTSMTLYRLADDKLRLRFRVDRVVIYSKAAGITQTFPAVAYSLNSGNILLKLLDHEIARQLNRYTQAWLRFAQADSDGRRIMMEFVLDPRDPQQAAAAASALRGEFSELTAMAAGLVNFGMDDTTVQKDYERLRDRRAEALGAAAFAASDVHSGKLRTFSANLPFLLAYNASNLFGQDKVTQYTGSGGEYRFYRADKSASEENFNAPWAGPLAKSNSQRAIEAVTYAAPGQKQGEPIVVYIRNQGFLRQTGESVRGTIEEQNAFLKLAGAQRGASGARLRLPTDALVPAPTPVFFDDSPTPHFPTDRKGIVAFTLVFSQKAVREMAEVTPEQVMRAVAAAAGASWRPFGDWLVANARMKGGVPTFDYKDARKEFHEKNVLDEGTWRPAGSLPTEKLELLSRQAAAVLADLAAVRGAKTNEARAEALARIMSGRGKSELCYEDALKVLIQFVDPMDLTGDFTANIRVSGKGPADTNAHLILKKGRSDVALLKDAGETKARFAEPSILTD